MAKETPKETPEQRGIVGRVMHEFKQGELESGSGRKVRSGRQAVAIALHEAGASDRESPRRNRQQLEHTRERATKAGLYAEARERGIPGRSRMDVAALRRALGR